MNNTLTLVGTGDALGVPRVYCDCPVCTEARTTGQNRRRRCSALVTGAAGTCWLDCGPDWRHQMESVGLRRVESVLITHAHHDHIGGLPDLYDLALWTDQRVQVYAPPRVMQQIATQYPWLDRGLALVPLEGTWEVCGYTVEAWEVNHGANGRSFAYRFVAPDFAWAYCPDSIDLNAAERRPLRGLDLLVLGTAYYQEDAPRRAMYSMVEALELLADVKPGRVLFTHLSHGVDVRADYGLPPQVLVGQEGVTMALRRA